MRKEKLNERQLFQKIFKKFANNLIKKFHMLNRRKQLH